MSYNDQNIRGNQSYKRFIMQFIVCTAIGIFCGWLGGIVISSFILAEEKENSIESIFKNFYNNRTRSIYANDAVYPKDPQIFALHPIITNFDSSPENWLRLDVALICDKTPNKVFLEILHQDIMAYVRTVSMKQITGSQGFRYFKEDVEERVKLRAQGFVSNVIFRTFIIA
ncbi:flagellar basal body-associated FliL family protein [Candidatus Liberibacter solanacearum]|uniref:Flagellar protein FliL n=1 Tax=Candidatus Liberibacter solanacearum TaxID=556287 RepID=A0A1V2N8E1_9HYPH|nr:flagellar basal body-associated FliL family protein [Candidatus Liberibacter solanacearum]ONI59787.1 flagellar basal body protein FliL [Candidatus Liberibacter solanacearum]ONI60016.1 flagellar basal body protein FliL [Candidatus Liberibacter solanacearum]